MRALELVKDRGKKEPDKERTDRVIRKACENGLLLVGAGTYGNVVRTLMPLVVSDAELTEGLDVLENALQSAKTPFLRRGFLAARIRAGSGVRSTTTNWGGA